MGLAINWWEDGWNIEQQSYQLNFAITDAVQMVLQTALSAITIYGNSSFSCGWIWLKLCQKMSTHHICPTYNLDQANPLNIAGEIAGSVDIDGPSMASENCYSSCSSATGLISLLFAYSSSACTHQNA
jgi:hypothetical protein